MPLRQTPDHTPCIDTDKRSTLKLLFATGVATLLPIIPSYAAPHTSEVSEQERTEFARFAAAVNTIAGEITRKRTTQPKKSTQACVDPNSVRITDLIDYFKLLASKTIKRFPQFAQEFQQYAESMQADHPEQTSQLALYERWIERGYVYYIGGIHDARENFMWPVTPLTPSESVNAGLSELFTTEEMQAADSRTKLLLTNMPNSDHGGLNDLHGNNIINIGILPSFQELTPPKYPISEKGYVDMVVANELTHAILKFGLGLANTSELDFLQSTTFVRGQTASRRHVHEFLSDVGSLSVNQHYISNLLHGSLANITRGPDGIWRFDHEIACGVPGYELTNNFFLAILQSLKRFPEIEPLLHTYRTKRDAISAHDRTKRNTKLQKERDQIVRYIFGWLTEEEIQYIRGKYVQNGKTLIQKIRQSRSSNNTQPTE